MKDSEVGSGSSLNISCGLFHSGLVVDGKLWVCGKGDGGRLGFGLENSVFVPSLNPYLGDDPVQCVPFGGVHSVALTSLGKIFTWSASFSKLIELLEVYVWLSNHRGFGGFGALGHSVYHRELFPRLVEGSWNGKIRHIATSGTHTAAITESIVLYEKMIHIYYGKNKERGLLNILIRLLLIIGELYTWVDMKEMEDWALVLVEALRSKHYLYLWLLFLVVFFYHRSCERKGNFGLGEVGGWRPKPILSLEDVRIILIASDEGKVLSWGYGGHGQLGHSSTENQKVPVVIEALADERVVYITCGGSSSAAITDKGKLYMWGNAKDSQLGVPGLPEVQPCPVEVKFLTEDDGLGPHKVLSVAVGASHAMCLVSSSNFELGRGDKVGGWRPKPITSLEDVRIIQTASGGYHSLALTDEGKVLSWGYGGHGQLGHCSTENQKVPVVIKALADERVVYIACGGSSSAAITDKGKLYMWGNAKDSQLGVPGLPEVQPCPVEVKFLTEDDGLGPHKVLSVAVGASHAMCLVSR
ncbi:hypothetical protein Pint_36467 [Pistacia integerrima]|uniref:Uncharacterized protein n=1 Tax=Pistacia integerrima TaxID=434235 RepID=A0ACC0XZQ1_9ROSI|nr:hypothetical protein Pint_36467 [Pistacia integerrima]